MSEYNIKSHYTAENQESSAYQSPSENGKPDTSTSHVAISKLQINNFRNYSKAGFDFDSNIIAIVGNNGVGKTNILEAITLLSKGRGLRSAEFNDMICNQSPDSGFTIFAQIENHPQISNIGTSYLKENSKRIFQINGKNIDNIKSSPALVWLSPQMDGLFIGPKNLRRKFLDRIAADIDFAHHSRINSYDKLLRERINLLNKYNQKADNKWLDIIEREISELGSAIAITRNETVEHLNKAILLNNSDFIKTRIKIIGDIEESALTNKALFVEEQFTRKLRENRNLDAKTGRTNFGIHRSEFTAILLDKDLEAKYCSTGEQKSILIALTFARASIFSYQNLPSAILLLDEIASHLDDNKKSALFREISKLNIQCFLTGVGKEIFSGFNDLKFIELAN